MKGKQRGNCVRGFWRNLFKAFPLRNNWFLFIYGVIKKLVFPYHDKLEHNSGSSPNLKTVRPQNSFCCLRYKIESRSFRVKEKKEKFFPFFISRQKITFRLSSPIFFYFILFYVEAKFFFLLLSLKMSAITNHLDTNQIRKEIERKFRSVFGVT